MLILWTGKKRQTEAYYTYHIFRRFRFSLWAFTTCNYKCNFTLRVKLSGLESCTQIKIWRHVFLFLMFSQSDRWVNTGFDMLSERFGHTLLGFSNWFQGPGRFQKLRENCSNIPGPLLRQHGLMVPSYDPVTKQGWREKIVPTSAWK